MWGNDGNDGRDGRDRRDRHDREPDVRRMKYIRNASNLSDMRYAVNTLNRERDVNNLSDTRNRQRNTNNLNDMRNVINTRNTNNLSDITMNTFLDLLKSRRFKYDDLSDNRTRAKHLTSQNDYKRRNHDTRTDPEDNPFNDTFTKTKANVDNSASINAIISSLIDLAIDHAIDHNAKADTKPTSRINHKTDTTSPDTHNNDSYLPPSSDAEFISSCEHYIAQQFNHKNIIALRHKLRTYLENNIDIDVFNDFKRLVHILDSCERSEESKDFITNLILKYRNL